MKLQGSDKIFWTFVERELKKQHRTPIKTWDEIKEELKMKYLPPSYRDRLQTSWITFIRVACLSRITWPNSMIFAFDVMLERTLTRPSLGFAWVWSPRFSVSCLLIRTTWFMF